MADWQPIATAPRDGTPVLAWEDGVAYVTEWQESFRDGFGDTHTGWVEPDVGELGPYPCHPSHWMPLPDPPTGCAPT